MSDKIDINRIGQYVVAIHVNGDLKCNIFTESKPNYGLQVMTVATSPDYPIEIDGKTGNVIMGPSKQVNEIEYDDNGHRIDQDQCPYIDNCMKNCKDECVLNANFEDPYEEDDEE